MVKAIKLTMIVRMETKTTTMYSYHSLGTHVPLELFKKGREKLKKKKREEREEREGEGDVLGASENGDNYGQDHGQ